MMDASQSSPGMLGVDCPRGYACVRIGAGDGGNGSSSQTAADAETGDVKTASPEEGGAATRESGPGDAGARTLSSMLVLDYRVVDAEQSAALSSIVMISDTPSNTLHVFNEVSHADVSIPLPLPPVAVAVDPSGQKAAVAFDANVSWVDLTTATLVKTCALGSNAYDLTLSAAGVAYVVPRTDQWVSLHAVDLTTCTETTASVLRAGSHIVPHPSGLAVFTADQGLSPSRINRCDVTVAPPNCTDAQNGVDWGTYNYCGNLWISADGQRIYTACGVTLRVPGNVNGSPCTYGGTLSGVTSVTHMAEAPSAQQIVLIPGVATFGSTSAKEDTVVRIHETAFLGLVTEFSLPSFPLPAGTASASHGRFVFTTSTLDSLDVIVQADPSSAALHDFAIASFKP
jgi:chitinase